MKTHTYENRLSTDYTFTHESFSVQAYIERIEEVEQQYKTQSSDNMIYDAEGINNSADETSEPHDGFNPKSFTCSSCMVTDGELV